MYQRDVSVRVGLRVGNFGPSTLNLNRLTGRIHPAEADLWVKLVPLLNMDSLMDSESGADGRFEIAGLDFGRYLLVVMRGLRVVHTEEVAMNGDREIDIALASGGRKQ